MRAERFAAGCAATDAALAEGADGYGCQPLALRSLTPGCSDGRGIRERMRRQLTVRFTSE